MFWINTTVLLYPDVVPNTCDSNTDELLGCTITNNVLLGLNTTLVESPPTPTLVTVQPVELKFVQCETFLVLPDVVT